MAETKAQGKAKRTKAKASRKTKAMAKPKATAKRKAPAAGKRAGGKRKAPATAARAGATTARSGGAGRAGGRGGGGPAAASLGLYLRGHDRRAATAARVTVKQERGGPDDQAGLARGRARARDRGAGGLRQKQQEHIDRPQHAARG